jgi:hypothetical protein
MSECINLDPNPVGPVNLNLRVPLNRPRSVWVCYVALAKRWG